MSFYELSLRPLSIVQNGAALALKRLSIFIQQSITSVWVVISGEAGSFIDVSVSAFQGHINGGTSNFTG